jgi:putative tryptophan/tyrosine transport system substrate-binding protein
MRRREFIAFLGSSLAGWPLAARAQQPTMPVIGFLGANAAQVSVKHLEAFRKGLSETGYVEGRNVAIEFRWAGGREDRMPELVADLVRRPVARRQSQSAGQQRHGGQIPQRGAHREAARAVA